MRRTLGVDTNALWIMQRHRDIPETHVQSTEGRWQQIRELSPVLRGRHSNRYQDSRGTSTETPGSVPMSETSGTEAESFQVQANGHGNQVSGQTDHGKRDRTRSREHCQSLDVEESPEHKRTKLVPRLRKLLPGIHQGFRGHSGSIE